MKPLCNGFFYPFLRDLLGEINATHAPRRGVEGGSIPLMIAHKAMETVDHTNDTTKQDLIVTFRL